MFSPGDYSASSFTATSLKGVGTRVKSADASSPESASKADGGSASKDQSAAAEQPAKQSDTFVAPRTLKDLYDGIQRDSGSPADARLAVMETIGRMNPEQLETLLSAEANNPDFSPHAL